MRERLSGVIREGTYPAQARDFVRVSPYGYGIQAASAVQLSFCRHYRPRQCVIRPMPAGGVACRVETWCDVGPLEVLAIECPGDTVKSDIIPALKSAIDSGSLRIVDVTFVHKDAQDTMSCYELANWRSLNSLTTISLMRRGDCCQWEISQRLAPRFRQTSQRS
jgi:hypothetical protein